MRAWAASLTEVDRLDAGRDAGGREPRAIVRVEHLDVLDAGHQRRRLRAGREDVERGPDRGIADRVDLRGDAAGRCAGDELGQLVGLGHPDAAAAVGRERPVRLGLDVGQERGGPGPERAVGEALLPADLRAAGRVAAERRAASEATLDGRRQRVVPQARVHAQRQTPRLREARVDREGVREVGSGATPPGSWQATTPSDTSSSPTSTMAAARSSGVGRRDVDRDEPGGGLVQHALRRPVRRPTDDAARRVVGTEAGGGEGRVAGPQGVMVVGPQRGAAARCDGLELVGGGPAAPSIAVPAVTLQPGVGREGIMRGAQPRQPFIERLRVREIDLPPRDGSLREMEVRVGQPGDRDLVGFQADALREWIGPRLEEHLGAGERDAAVADPDRFDPAEPLVALQGRDAAGDQRFERHGRSA